MLTAKLFFLSRYNKHVHIPQIFLKVGCNNQFPWLAALVGHILGMKSVQNQTKAANEGKITLKNVLVKGQG